MDGAGLGQQFEPKPGFPYQLQKNPRVFDSILEKREAGLPHIGGSIDPGDRRRDDFVTHQERFQSRFRVGRKPSSLDFQIVDYFTLQQFQIVCEIAQPSMKGQIRQDVKRAITNNLLNRIID
jgi:hypothetical protein